MSRVFHDIKVGLDEDLKEKLEWLSPGFSNYRVLRESVDARRRHDPHFVYSVEVLAPGEPQDAPPLHLEKVNWREQTTPLIIGSGPAGLFAALRFVERGIPCTLIEQGSETNARMKAINKFWRYGDLDPKNNVGFGEGGAGLYSDGKLITRIKSPHIAYVMDRLIKFGAPPEIRYLANPHVGSDRIRRVIPVMRQFLLDHGCTIHFDTKFTELLTRSEGGKTSVYGIKAEGDKTFLSDHIILATGHSADSVFEELSRAEVHMDGKSFAVGLRIEHPQSVIDKMQYREALGHPKLGPANYKLTYHNSKEDYGVYSFCMCPGGYVLNSSTVPGEIVSNGMSNYNRNSPFANAAIVVSIDHQKTFGNDIWGGVKFRSELERAGKRLVEQAGGTRELPAQRLHDFINGTTSELRPGSSPSKAVATRLDQILPKEIRERLIEGFEKFSKTMPEFLGPEAQLYGIESRTSCPLRVTRNAETLQSISHLGLYPCGEGAGYAGGITSAACDGIKIADVIAETVSSQHLAVT